ncbi:MarR family winged helix-turn-helix transcriptional regulator [Intrasporangium oryzae]|uniref:MarR family winged helix-turn-helix transcriptional regulator n=1 Tax=Intrasporangium oryzae TaxID=412687 RepID=UPI0004B11584|nr:MarR family transcriptional regulator [Intrasporangium oryzae]
METGTGADTIDGTIDGTIDEAVGDAIREPSSGADPDDLLRLDQQVCFALAVAARTVIGLYRPILEPLGLTHPQYLVMLALWERSPLTVRQIGELISLEPATLSPLLKRLEASGLVTRERHPADDRALAITLTAEGRALRQRALEVPPQVIDRLGMPLEALHDLHRSLTAVIAAGAAAQRTAGGPTDGTAGPPGA